MSFNTALSGLAAASSNLNVIGNNVANTSTSGFKSSRAEFGDVYAASTIGTGSNAIGSGIKLSSVSQQFTQGNIEFTNNSLDMAITGNGFFILNDSGATKYSRSGMFGLDRDGFLVNKLGNRLQGFGVSSTGQVVGGTLRDLQVNTSNQSPRRSTLVKNNFNLDASNNVLAVRGTTAQTLGTSVGVASTTSLNGYPSEAIVVSGPTGSQTVTTAANASSQTIAAQFSQVQGVSATATSTARITGFNNAGSLMTLNGVTITGSTPAAFAASINSLTGSTLPGVTASVSGGVVTVVSNSGANLTFSVNNSGNAADTMTVQGMVNGAASGGTVTISGAGGGASTVAGVVNLTLEENYAFGSGSGQIFTPIVTQTPFVQNTFDSSNPDTYNAATSSTVYDSLGVAHVMTQFFVKESNPNTWTMYVQIDGVDVGDPNTALPPPEDMAPTSAAYTLVFNDDGTLNDTLSEPVLISYWNPLDPDAQPNGADTALTVANGGGLPLVDPPNSSNFQIDMENTTQFGSPFAVNSLSQNGYTTGRLSGVDVNKDGIIYARYTNGQSQVLGQVALSNFANAQGLKPLGSTSWAQSFDSGDAVIGTPGSGSLGLISAGALEASNVELSSELVKMIVAQRDYQANAKTIQTEDTVTQTILNMR